MHSATDTSSIHNCNVFRVTLVKSPTTKNTFSVHGRKHCTKKTKKTCTSLFGAWSSTIFWKNVHIFINTSNAVSHRIYGSQYCDHIKHAGTPSAQAKSRPDILVFHDKLHGLLVHSWTAQNSSQCLFLVTYWMFIYFLVFI